MTEGSIALLEKTLEILETSRWCQGTFAVDATGSSARLESPDACGFCLRGAMLRACRALHFRERGLEDYRARLALECVIGGRCIADYNDVNGRTPEQVQAAVRTAISLIKQQSTT